MSYVKDLTKNASKTELQIETLSVSDIDDFFTKEITIKTRGDYTLTYQILKGLFFLHDKKGVLATTFSKRLAVLMFNDC